MSVVSPLRQPMPPDENMSGSTVGPTSEADFETLRNLLLGEEWVDLNVLRKRLRDPELHAHDLSLVLAKAIVRASQRDTKLRSALLPVVEDAIRISVQRDPKVLANLIYPAIGGALLKSVASLLEEKLEALNMVVEQSFTLRGLQWRVEAWRTGKTVGEIAMLRSLLFRVEHVLLIDPRTGLLLARRSAPGAKIQDPDMMSGMLTAIRDFVADSFGEPQNQDLQTVQVGEFRLWIEHGPLAMLVGVVRGPAPVELRKVFRQALQEIHAQFGTALAEYRGGDVSSFVAAESTLERCLMGTAPATATPPKYRLWLALAGLGLAFLFGYWGFREGQHRRSMEIAQQLNQEPGIVVTQMERRDGKLQISGFRDPLASDPSAILRARGLPENSFQLSLREFESGEPSLIARRQRAAHREWLANLSILFEENSTAISPLAVTQLEEVAKRLKTIFKDRPPAQPVIVYGSANGTGATNRSLAEARAVAIVNLLADLGVPRQWFQVSFRLSEPSGDNPTQRRLARRVYFKLEEEP
ncbi:MAG: OmpA family protein [Bryobacteraceae bacterium]|nr:OmpA family protein [Bryobacteraceae bacterium]MDW8376778.1 OmpA family protein [Bryobacterales bacterium]